MLNTLTLVPASAGEAYAGYRCDLYQHDTVCASAPPSASDTKVVPALRDVSQITRTETGYSPIKVSTAVSKFVSGFCRQ